MLDALEHNAGALPLLQLTAAKLWELRDRTRCVLTEASYREIGGVAGTLAGHADAVLGAMSPDERKADAAKEWHAGDESDELLWRGQAAQTLGSWYERYRVWQLPRPDAGSR